MHWESATPIEVERCDPRDGVDWLDASKWVRNESDRFALENGCFFDAAEAAYACWWMESQLRLYEDPFSDQPIRFLSTKEDPTFQFYDEATGKQFNLQWDVPPIEEPWGWDAALSFYEDRMRLHNKNYHNGQFMHWHAEAVFQCYGWARHTKDERALRRGIKQVRRFRQAIIWCAKKNGKSPFTAANAIFLAFGDGEGGASIGFAASNLEQARKTVGKHLFEMVDSSPNLESAKTHKNNFTVTMDKCTIFPVSAGNEKTANAQHGTNMNGAVIDEVHVVSRKVYDRIYRSTRSRLQPFLWEVSTAGDNPEGWGKEEFDKSCDIRDGIIETDNVYVAIYAAPQNASDKQIAANIEEYIRMANPALGHIVGLEQSLDDYQQAKNSAADLATFKYEILNIWVNASVTWLEPGIWESCGGWQFDSLSEEELQARCVIGFDFANRLDLAAAVLSWEYWFAPDDAVNPEHVTGTADPNDPNYDSILGRRRGCFQQPFFWTNEQRLRQLKTKYKAFAQWEDAGLLRVCPGASTSETWVAQHLRELIQQYNVVGMIHDPYFCGAIVDYLTRGVVGPDNSLLVEPVFDASQCYAMSQVASKQAGPVAAFEQDLKSEIIGHFDDPIINWQIGHATVATDKKNGNQTIVKENRKSFRTVDGVQASVMSRYGLLEYEPFAGDRRLNYYESHELEEL